MLGTHAKTEQLCSERPQLADAEIGSCAQGKLIHFSQSGLV